MISNRHNQLQFLFHGSVFIRNRQNVLGRYGNIASFGNSFQRSLCHSLVPSVRYSAILTLQCQAIPFPQNTPT